jgi:F0F1-type ATP synthase epsilon subunit
LRVSVLEPHGVIWKGNAREVILPGDDGELCILDFHQPIVCSLRSGFVRIKDSQTQTEKRFPVKQGIARMRAGELTVLALV